MCAPRFGELLGRLVSLSPHDVNEILEDQNATHRRFGEIALSWGLCRPQDVWQAWSDQLLSEVQKVDLQLLGVDAQAAAMLGPEAARRLGAIPIRCMNRQLIVAVADANHEQVAAELSRLTSRELRFVLADREQIQLAIAVYYPASPAAA